MDKERYVTFKVAQLLKDKGFDWPCRAYWHEDNKELIESQSQYHLRNITNPCWFGNTAPTQQMACDWVEETYGFFIEISRSIDLNGDYLYRYAILDKRNFVSKLNHIYKSKEDAVEAALEYVLTDLI